MIKRLLVLSILFWCSSAWAQNFQTFNGYVSSLPQATTPFGAGDALYLLQGNQSRQTPASTLAQLTAFPVDRYGATGNGIADDTGPINLAMTACLQAGGGMVVLGPHRYLVDTADITVPVGCQIFCPAPPVVTKGPTNQIAFTTMKYAIILNSGFSVVLQDSTGITNCSILQKGIASTVPGNIRTNIGIMNAFAGNAIELGTGTRASANDVTIRDIFIGGFTWGVIPGGETAGSYTPNAAAAHVARLHMDHVKIDATNCVWLDQSHDISELNYVECFPFLIAGFANTAQYDITGVANNGTGDYRVTTGANAIVNLDTVWFTNRSSTNVARVGVASAQNNWIAAVISATQTDLRASTVSLAGTPVTPTGDTISGDPIVRNLSSFAGVGVGDTITGANIPGGTTITAIWPGDNAVVLSANSTGTATRTTVTVTDAAWSAGGSLMLDASYRAGTAFYFTNSETAMCHFCFAYNHLDSFRFGSAIQYFDCVGCGSDAQGTDNANSVAVLLDNTTSTQGIKFMGGTFLGQAEIIQGDGPNGGVGNSFINASISPNKAMRMMMEFDNGSWFISGNSHGGTLEYYVGFSPNVDKSVILGNIFPTDVAVYVNGVETKVNDTANQWGP